MSSSASIQTAKELSSLAPHPATPLSFQRPQDLRTSSCFTPFAPITQTQTCSNVITQIMVLASSSHLSLEVRSQAIASVLKGINIKAQVLEKLSAQLKVEPKNLPQDALARHPALVCDILLDILPFTFQVSAPKREFVNIPPSTVGDIITLCTKIAVDRTLKLEEKTVQINQLLAQRYTPDQLACVYDALYVASKDFSKTGGREWSKSHIGDNTALLCNVLLDHLPADKPISHRVSTESTVNGRQESLQSQVQKSSVTPHKITQIPYKKYLFYGTVGLAALATVSYFVRPTLKGFFC